MNEKAGFSPVAELSGDMPVSFRTYPIRRDTWSRMAAALAVFSRVYRPFAASRVQKSPGGELQAALALFVG